MKLNISTYLKRIILAGIIALAILLIGVYIIGNISGYQAKELLKKSLEGLNVLSNTIILAAATILALLLTVLNITSDLKNKIKDGHYINILWVAKVDTAVLILAMLSFLIFNLPITESDNLPQNWFTIIYYISIAISSLLGAGLIVVILMLYTTIAIMIRSIGLGHDTLYVSEEEVEKEKEKEKNNNSSN